MNRQAIKGDSLLQLSEKDGDVAVFEILLKRSKKLQVAPGTKILLGKPENQSVIQNLNESN